MSKNESSTTDQIVTVIGIKRYYWKTGDSLETALQSAMDSAMFANKSDPDRWIDDFRAALKLQPLEWYRKHMPQAVLYIEAANRAFPMSVKKATAHERT